MGSQVHTDPRRAGGPGIAGRYGKRSPGYDHIEVFAEIDEYGIPILGDEVD